MTSRQLISRCEKFDADSRGELEAIRGETRPFAIPTFCRGEARGLTGKRMKWSECHAEIAQTTIKTAAANCEVTREESVTERERLLLNESRNEASRYFRVVAVGSDLSRFFRCQGHARGSARLINRAVYNIAGE